MTKDPCGSCGSTTYYLWQKTGDIESCNDCARILDNSPRDYFGQKIRIPTERLGTFSYAVGEVVHSAHQYSRILKEKGLVQKNP